MGTINLTHLKPNQLIRTQCNVLFLVKDTRLHYQNEYTAVYKVKACKMPLSSYANPVRVFYFYRDGQSAFGQPFLYDIIKIDE